MAEQSGSERSLKQLESELTQLKARQAQLKEKVGNTIYAYKKGTPEYNNALEELKTKSAEVNDKIEQINSVKKSESQKKAEAKRKAEEEKAKVKAASEGKEYVPPAASAETPAVVDQQNYSQLLKDAPSVIKNLSDTEKKLLSDKLNKAGIKISNPLDVEQLLGGYQEALTKTQNYNKLFGESLSIDEYLAGKKGAGDGTTAYTTISDPTQAQATITSAFKTILFRDPTAEEITKYTKLLNDAERKNPTKTVNGITTGGINKTQFLTNLIKEAPEFKTAESQRILSATQDLQKAATANGITLTQDLIDSYAQRLKGGEDINTLKASFREMAKLGMPDSIKKLLDQGLDLSTIYSPYKSIMASTLELDPNSITLNDNMLRSAIGKEGEIPLYQFQTALRKDPRWQYTDNAKQTVSNSVLKVLQDFGFRG